MGLQIENMSADETLRAKPTSLQETYRHLPLKCFAEFMAMLVFVFIGCGTAMVQPRPENADGTPMSNAVLSGDSSTNPAVFQICLAFGMAILCLVYSTCGISGVMQCMEEKQGKGAQREVAGSPSAPIEVANPIALPQMQQSNVQERSAKGDHATPTRQEAKKAGFRGSYDEPSLASEPVQAI